MPTTLENQIDNALEQLKEIALDIVDDLDMTHEMDDSYACFINKKAYDAFVKLDIKINKLRTKQITQSKKRSKK